MKTKSKKSKKSKNVTLSKALEINTVGLDQAGFGCLLDHFDDLTPNTWDCTDKWPLSPFRADNWAALLEVPEDQLMVKRTVHYNKDHTSVWIKVNILYLDDSSAEEVVTDRIHTMSFIDRTKFKPVELQFTKTR